MRLKIRLSVFGKLILLITSFAIIPLSVAVGMMIGFHPQLLWPALLGFSSVSLFTLSAAFIFARHLTRPIRALMRGSERIAHGDFSTLVQVDTHDELQDLAQAFNRMSEDMRRYSELHVDEVLAEKTKT